ncbi:MAG: hypothetical protein IJQ80_00975, partial [Clostridia bacterium]|nr:hypothetical protein [Clostridia bacterium]
IKIKIVFAAVFALLIFSSSQSVMASPNYRALALDEESLDLVSRAVCVEGDGKSCLAKACIASMLFNRMSDEYLSRSATEAVYESGALIRAEKEDVDAPISPDALYECRTLVRLVYYFGIDPTCGALFCFCDGDPEADQFFVTISLDGLVFAAP